MQKKKPKRSDSAPKLFGTATVGTKGQIVIPAGARKSLNINTGDQLLIVGNETTKVLALVKTDEISNFIKDLSAFKP